MFKKSKQGKSFHWVIASIILACIGVAFDIASWEINDLLGFGFLIFTILAVYCGLMAIGSIIRNKKILIGIVQLLVLILGGTLVFSYFSTQNYNFRTRRAIIYNRLLEIRELNYLLNVYVKKYGQLPDAQSWFDSLEKRIDDRLYTFLPINDPNSSFAFNKNSSNTSTNDLDDNVVLLIEADGENNLSGSFDLIVRKRAKDTYFLFKRQRFIYVLFVDGTIAKYRLHDSAVALYKPDTDEFTDWLKQGQTPYSPLRWE